MIVEPESAGSSEQPRPTSADQPASPAGPAQDAANSASDAKPAGSASDAKSAGAAPEAKPAGSAPDPEPAGSAPNERPAGSTPSAPSGGSAADASVEDSLIPIDLFAKIDLRVATVLHVEPHPNADRLLKLQIDLGSERRQLVAGLASHYRPEDLIGKQIIVVANLKPAKLRGELSQGMLLAASDADGVAILRPERPMAPGSQVR
jgi:methionyl-tRNA synthetase